MCHDCRSSYPVNEDGATVVPFRAVRVAIIVIALLVGMLWNYPTETEGVDTEGRYIVSTELRASP